MANPQVKCLPVGAEIRHHLVKLLRAAVGKPESGDDLVEDQGNVVARGQFSHPLKKPRLRANGPLERLDDDGGDLRGMTGEHLLGGGKIVERGDKHAVSYRRTIVMVSLLQKNTYF